MKSPTGKGIRSDSMGDGHYGSKRGRRKHEGVDWLADVDQEVVMPIDSGKILRMVYPYKNTLHFKGMVIEGKDEGDRVFLKLMYVEPAMVAGRTYKKGQVIGYAQDIAHHYNDPKHPKMLNHVHMEVYKRYDYAGICQI